jgi:hypothetical protein
MAGFGYTTYGTKTGKSKTYGLGGNQNKTNSGGTTANNFNNYNYNPQGTSAGTSDAVNQQLDYLKNIPTGLTAEQELAMRNRIRSTDTAQTRGGYNKIRELMAAQGLSGGGAEQSGILSMLRNQSATRQGALSDLDINNANMSLQNQYNKAGLMNSAVGMGEQARQFGLGQAQNMYQFGASLDESTRQYDQQRNDYQQQLQDWLDKMGQGGNGSSGSSTSKYTWNRSKKR